MTNKKSSKPVSYWVYRVNIDLSPDWWLAKQAIQHYNSYNLIASKKSLANIINADKNHLMPLKPEQIKKLRSRAGLTQAEAAKLIHATRRTWQNWEADEGTPDHRKMPESSLELFCIKTGQKYPPEI